MSKYMKICKNYRANEKAVTLPGACIGHVGQILADLYNADGTFHRTAVVADVGACGVEVARRYARKANTPDLLPL